MRAEALSLTCNSMQSESLSEFTNRLTREVNVLFGVTDFAERTSCALQTALEKTQCCLSQCVGISRIHTPKTKSFNAYDSTQYCIMLYFTANELYRQRYPERFYTITYLLNKALHAIDLMYDVALPSVFFGEHPVGSVIGRAKFGNNFLFRQCCTIGSSGDLYPQIGSNVEMCANSMILGGSVIEDFVCVSSGAVIKSQHIPRCSIVFGQSPNLTIVSKPIQWFEKRSIFIPTE